MGSGKLSMAVVEDEVCDNQGACKYCSHNLVNLLTCDNLWMSGKRKAVTVTIQGDHGGLRQCFVDFDLDLVPESAQF